MKKILFCLFVFTAIHTQSFALLPPLWQQIQELKVILADKKIGDFLDAGDPITSIKKVDDGWVIITAKRRVIVQITYEKATEPGPAHFRVKFVEG